MLFIGITSCKTTESNYKAAYETAAERRASKVDAEDDFLSIPDQSVTVTTFLSPIKTTEKDTITPAEAPRFSVAVNKFKQVFNAKALCNRLRADGWTSAYVAQTPEDEYYVMARGFANEDEAKVCLQEIKSDKRVPFGRGYPTLIRAAWK